MAQRIAVLTRWELEIVELLASGLSSKQAAAQCGVSARTIETYLSAMRLKLRARNAVHLVAIAMITRMIPDRPPCAQHDAVRAALPAAESEMAPPPSPWTEGPLPPLGWKACFRLGDADSQDREP